MGLNFGFERGGFERYSYRERFFFDILEFLILREGSFLDGILILEISRGFCDFEKCGEGVGVFGVRSF